MEKQFPRAGKTQPGGTKVNLSCLISCKALPAEDAVLKNPIPH
jgi:hypothetical protein